MNGFIECVNSGNRPGIALIAVHGEEKKCKITVIGVITGRNQP